MSVESFLLWEKWRPKRMEDIILLPRIQKELENGITQHYIFHGHYGTGKTSLARLLIGKYSKKTPFLELNCSIDTSIDVLRTQIDDFCKFNPMFETDSDLKFVFLDEFDRVSPNFQDAFKAFIEKYNKKVRFIITTNHINKIIPGLKSRIKCIDFDCVTKDEEKFLKQEIYKKISLVILPVEEVEIPKQDLINIITRRFPDFRATLVDVQSYIETGSSNSTDNISNDIKNDLYDILYSSADYEECYHFLMNSFGPEKIHSMINLLGRPFIDWYLKEKKGNVDKLFEVSYVISDYSSKLETDTDPIILGMNIIGKIRNILK